MTKNKIIIVLIIITLILSYIGNKEQNKKTFANAGKFLTSKQQVRESNPPIPQKLKWYDKFKDK